MAKQPAETTPGPRKHPADLIDLNLSAQALGEMKTLWRKLHSDHMEEFLRWISLTSKQRAAEMRMEKDQQARQAERVRRRMKLAMDEDPDMDLDRD